VTKTSAGRRLAQSLGNMGGEDIASYVAPQAPERVARGFPSSQIPHPRRFARV